MPKYRAFIQMLQVTVPGQVINGFSQSLHKKCCRSAHAHKQRTGQTDNKHIFLPLRDKKNNDNKCSGAGKEGGGGDAAAPTSSFRQNRF